MNDKYAWWQGIRTYNCGGWPTPADGVFSHVHGDDGAAYRLMRGYHLGPHQIIPLSNALAVRVRKVPKSDATLADKQRLYAGFRGLPGALTWEQYVDTVLHGKFLAPSSVYRQLAILSTNDSQLRALLQHDFADGDTNFATLRMAYALHTLLAQDDAMLTLGEHVARLEAHDDTWKHLPEDLSSWSPSTEIVATAVNIVGTYFGGTDNPSTMHSMSHEQAIHEFLEINVKLCGMTQRELRQYIGSSFTQPQRGVPKSIQDVLQGHACHPDATYVSESATAVNGANDDVYVVTMAQLRVALTQAILAQSRPDDIRDHLLETGRYIDNSLIMREVAWTITIGLSSQRLTLIQALSALDMCHTCLPVDETMIGVIHSVLGGTGDPADDIPLVAAMAAFRMVKAHPSKSLLQCWNIVNTVRHLGDVETMTPEILVQLLS